MPCCEPGQNMASTAHREAACVGLPLEPGSWQELKGIRHTGSAAAFHGCLSRRSARSRSVWRRRLTGGLSACRGNEVLASSFLRGGHRASSDDCSPLLRASVCRTIMVPRSCRRAGQPYTDGLLARTLWGQEGHGRGRTQHSGDHLSCLA